MADLRSLIEEVLSKKENKTGLHVGIIVDQICLLDAEIGEDKEKLQTKVNTILLKEAGKKTGLFTKVKNPKTNKPKKGYYRLVVRTGVKQPMPKPITNTGTIFTPEDINDTSNKKKNLFTGKAGECAVMSELLFREYNVNTFVVDDGVDIVATKNNEFFLIQVKTTEVQANGKIHAAIKRDRYVSYQGFKIVYIIVARCKISGIDTNIYFKFTNGDIEQFRFNRYISDTANDINIKIQINGNGEALLYDGNRSINIEFWKNNFDL